MKLTLQAARVNKGLSTTDAAKKIGVTARTLRSWEKGETFPNVIQVNVIQKTYDISYDNIVFFTQQKD